MAPAQRFRESLDVVATMATILACVAVISAAWSGGIGNGNGNANATRPPNPSSARGAPLPEEPVSLEGAARVGRESAKVVLMEWTDFQCPYCTRAAKETLPALIEKYVTTGKVQFVLRHLPLEQIHPLAQKAAEAAECAGQQGRFWDMHDRLYDALDRPALEAHATGLALDTRRFVQCLDTGEMAAKVKRDAADARALQISGTPTFLVGTLEPGNRVKLVRRVPGGALLALEEALDAMLKVVGQ